MARKKYYQGFFKPKNPEKYIGDCSQIIYRSGLEYKYMNFFDRNPNILQWGSEEFSIPYFSRIDKRMHRYFPDMIIKIKNKNEEIKEYVVEIKPYVQSIIPKKTNKNTKSYRRRVFHWIKNEDKWNASKKWCERNNMKFIILTEKDLEVNKQSTEIPI